MSGVTFKVAEHEAKPVRSNGEKNQQLSYLVSELDDYRKGGCERVLQGTPIHNLSCFESCDSGFVTGITNAYCNHHNLTIRPDDVWLAIIIQFGFFVNANAESLRSLFVSHAGKKELVVRQFGTLDTADYAQFATEMVAQLRGNLKDPDFCNWVLPRFSTTTPNDTIVGSVALMGSMKQYFKYKCCLLCGIPQVTLAGTVEDWEEVHLRVERLQLGGYGKECSSWGSMLEKITMQFVKTSRNNIDLGFWSRICDYSSGGSGPTYLSGWVTAFCVFDGKGKWQATRYSVPDWSGSMPQVLEFPVIDTEDIPHGYITVDVIVDDNGKEFKTLMFAGHMGFDIVQEGKGIAPTLAWAIVVKSQSKAIGVKSQGKLK